MNSWDKYVDDVIMGEIITGEYIRLACIRYNNFLKNDNIYFDTDKVNNVITFISSIKHYLGRYAGKPFILLPWQEFIIASIFGFYYKSNNKRMVNNVFILMSRKQGKSALSAALALYLLIADGEQSPEIVFSANSREQARIILDITTQFAKSLDPKGKHIKIYRNEIKFGVNNGKANIVSSDASKLDGKNISAYIIDEFHEQKNNKMVDVLASSQGMRLNPLGIIISTAGFNLQSPCYEQYTTSIEILEGIKTDDSLFSAIYTIDINDEWDDESVWCKSSPNLDTTVSKDYIRNQINKAKNNPSEEVGVKTKLLNIWCSSSDYWIAHEKLVKHSKKLDITDFYGDRCWVGVDLASVNDLTAVSYMFIRDDKYYFFTDMYLPHIALTEHKQHDYYQNMHRKKCLKITAGNVTDYKHITEDILRVNNNCPVQGVYYDTYNSIQWAVDSTEKGLNLIPYSQSVSNFNRPTKEFLRLFLSEKVVLDDNELTRFCFSNAVIFRDNNDNEKPKKMNDKSKIDAVISCLQSLGGYLATPKEAETFVY